MSNPAEKKVESMEKEAATGTERLDRRYLHRAFHNGYNQISKLQYNYLFFIYFIVCQRDLNAPDAHKPLLSRLESGMPWTCIKIEKPVAC